VSRSSQSRKRADTVQRTVNANANGHFDTDETSGVLSIFRRGITIGMEVIREFHESRLLRSEPRRQFLQCTMPRTLTMSSQPSIWAHQSSRTTGRTTKTGVAEGLDSEDYRYAIAEPA
jgi:hypothetical protein